MNQRLSAVFSTPQIMKSWDHECFLPRRQDRSGLRYQPLAVYNLRQHCRSGTFQRRFPLHDVMIPWDHECFLARRQDRFGFASVEREVDRQVRKRER